MNVLGLNKLNVCWKETTEKIQHISKPNNNRIWKEPSYKVYISPEAKRKMKNDNKNV